MNYIEFNSKIWDDINECLVDNISREDYIASKNGDLNVSLAGIKQMVSGIKGEKGPCSCLRRRTVRSGICRARRLSYRN